MEMRMKAEIAKANHWLMYPRPNPEASLRLFCFPFAGGGAQSFGAWPDGLPATLEVCSVQLPGREQRVKEPPLSDLVCAVDALTLAIIPHLDKPFAFFGHGLGAILAFELARKLRRDYRALPEVLVVSARAAPHLQIPRQHIHDLPDAEFVQALKALHGTPREVLEDAAVTKSTMPFLRADLAMHEKYTYVEEPPLDCDLIAFGGLKDSEANRESLDAWRNHTTNKFVRRLFPGDHFFVVTARTLFLRMFSQELYRIANRVRLQPKKSLLPTDPLEHQGSSIEITHAKKKQSSANKKSDIADWFYASVWSEVTLSKLPISPDPDNKSSHWLVFLDSCGIGAHLVERLKAVKHDVTTVHAGAEFAKTAPGRYVINPANPSHYKMVVRGLRDSGTAIEHIVHLWSVTGEAEQSFDELQKTGFYSLLSVAKALGENRITGALKLDIVANQLYAADAAEDLSPGKATLLGPCRIIPQEYPNVTCRSIDVLLRAQHPADQELLLNNLFSEITSDCLDVAICYRNGRRLVQSFSPVRLEEVAPDKEVLRQGGVYLITGGLGIVGFVLAEMMAQNFGAKVVLTTRQAFPPKLEWQQWLASHDERDDVSAKIRRIQVIEEKGGHVIVLTADVADEIGMREVFATIDDRFGTLNGVVHAAGLTASRAHRVIQEISLKDCEEHFKAKVHGTMVLERLLRERDVDFCLLFSSISVILGGITLSAYAAGNAFLDSFADQRNKAAGTRWIAVNWDTWKAQKDKNKEKGSRDQKYKGLETTIADFVMWPQEGAEAFRRVLGSTTANYLLNSTADLQSRLDQWIYRKDLREKKVAKRRGAPSYYSRPNLSTAYTAANNETEERVARVLQDVLGIEKVGLHDNYFEMGGNSLVALQVVAELQREFDAQLSPITIFEAPTVSELAKLLGPAKGNTEEGDSLRLLTGRRQRIKEHSNNSEIAIIGMAGRFPGADSVAELWQNVRNGVESLTYFSDDELLESGVDPADLRRSNYIKARPILEDVDQFDAGFFGYSPRDAEFMDPQHRLMLETASQALEDAGYDPTRYPGAIGVFAGSNVSLYWLNMRADADLWSEVNRSEVGLANDKDSLTTKVSYKLNLKGPSFAVQTFCSTSLVAVHLACQSLRAGESDMVLAGGVSLQVPTKLGYMYEAGNQASPDGHTRTFDAKAKGTVFSDGVGLVVLKRLEDALADGDTIHAVIKGSAINNDGSLKVGYTAPSVERQAEVVALALADARLTADDISYVEAHGTATELGDPIEVTALSRAFRVSTEAKRYCALGSVKPNIGHVDRAAGIAGLIKTVEALKASKLPPTLFFEQPNPKIDFENSPFFVNTMLSEWPSHGAPRRAGVNALGVGGTNAHVIVEEAPAKEESGGGRRRQLLTLSAKTGSALEAMTGRLAEHLRETAEINLGDVAYTLQVGRREFGERRVVVCENAGEAIAGLQSLDAKKVFSSTREARKRPVVFLFPGVGEQYGNMAAGLYEEEGEFRTLVDECCELLQRETGVDLRTILFAEKAAGTGSGDLQKLFFRGVGDGEGVGERLNQTWLAQPAVFVIEYCLARLLMSWGIVPEALIGNSVGEYAAAVIAGVMSLGDGLRLVAGRGKLIEKLGGGAMLAVALGEEQLQPLLGEKLSIAISNGPKLTVVSGTEEAIAELEVTLQQKEMVSRRLQTRHAFHSRMMEPAYGEFVKLVETVELKAPQIPYISNVTGSWIKEEEARDAHYWARHMCQRVRFGEGISEILRGGEKVLVEVGPGQGLGSVVKQHPEYQRRNETVVISTMRTVYGREADQEVLLGALGKLWLAGTEIEWAAR